MPGIATGKAPDDRHGPHVARARRIPPCTALALEGMTRILLVRHAPTAETGTRLTGRLAGVSIGEEGERAALSTAREIADLDLAAVYSSPIERTLETARILARPHGLSPIEEPGVTEIDFGSWTGQTLESLRQEKEWKTVQSNPSRFRFPKGESFVEAQVRAVRSVERIAEERDGSTVVVVSHSDTIKLVLAHFLGQPLDLFQRLRISTASISDLRLGCSGPPVVVSINATGVDG